ncbi:MAG: arylsulfatase [Akkermansiaceae bacterium]|jgi:arylsulfatase
MTHLLTLLPSLAFLISNLGFGAERPNILLILADDLGYSDLGCYGSEIKTPHLDSLAQNGLRFTNFYNTARCWPTRASILTGYYPQQIRRDTIKGKPGPKKGKRPAFATLAPVHLKPLGYRSYHVGKWHLDGMPIASGFDRSYYLQDQSRFFNPETHHLDDTPLPPVKKGSDFYATTELASRTIEFLTEHETKHQKAPFFTYLAFAAPHFPLHALPQDIAKYEKIYPSGWEAIRTKRHQRMAKLGFPKVALSPVLPDLGPPYHFPDHLKILGPDEVNRPLPWNSLTESQQKFQAHKMAIHAAMIDRMDQEIGRVIAHLKKTKQFGNTLILFLSDNGASAEIMVRGDGHDPKAPMGSVATYLCLGPGWSTVANTPFKKHKTWTHEGGIATPLIAHWPQGIPTQKGQNEFRHTPAHVIDLLPTLLGLTSKKVEKLPGKNLLPVFKADQPDFHEALWWSHEGNHAIQENNWKAVSSHNEPWELYNLSQDRSETKNLATKHPDKLKQLITFWEKRADQYLSDAQK